MKILIVFILVHIVHIYAASIANRRSPHKNLDSSHVLSKEGIENFVHAFVGVPLIGSYLEETVIYLMKLVEIMDDMSLGIVSNVLQSTQPCIYDEEKGFYCVGLSKKGANGIMKEVVNGLPNALVPDFAKPIVINLIESITAALQSSILGD